MNVKSDQAGVNSIPSVRGWPYFGSLEMLQDPITFVSEKYKQHGPIFRMRLMGGEKIVLAGREAAEFFSSSAPDLWGRKLIFEHVNRDLGTQTFIPALEGPVREHFRRIMQLGFSREIVGRYLPELWDSSREVIQSWQPGSTIDAVDALGHLAAAQMGLVTANCSLDEITGDISKVLVPMFGVPLGIFPAFSLKAPGYQAAKRRVANFFQRVKKAHEEVSPGEHRKADIIDLLLTSKDEHDKPLDENTILVTTLFGWASGQIYVARHYAFLLYSLLKNPEILERVIDEVRTACADGMPDISTLRKMRTLRGASMESLRKYPIQTVMPFRVRESFEFSGHTIPAGSLIYFVPNAAHSQSSIYPKPDEFDADRFFQPRSEHRLKYAFTSYGVYPRNCIAAGMVELLTLVTFTSLFRGRRFEFHKPDYQLKIVLRPVPSPDKKFDLNVLDVDKDEHEQSAQRESSTDEAPLLTQLTYEQINEAATSTRTEDFEPGQVVIRQGDVADNFYIIVEGQAEVIKEQEDGGERSLVVLGPDDYFGEIGLLEDCNRTATVRATGDSRLRVLVVDRVTFSNIVANGDLMSDEIAHTVKRRVVSLNLREALPSLNSNQLSSTFGQYETRTYAPGKDVVTQGDAADRFYVISGGRARVLNFHPNGEEIELATLGPGEFFGEIGLLHGVPRTATVRVSDAGPLETIELDRDAFSKMWNESDDARSVISRAVEGRLMKLSDTEDQHDPGESLGS